MTPPRRPRTGTRRDGEVRVIRTNEIRYPGTALPTMDADAPAPDSTGSGLGPARDTGLALEGRRARETRRRAAQKRQQVIAGVAAVVLLGALALGWQYSSDRRAKTELLAESPFTQAPLTRTNGPSPALPVARAASSQTEPTPLLATYHKLQIRLPVSVEDLTEVGFHQASYPYALRLTTKVPDANMAKAKKDRSTHRDPSAQKGGADAWLAGTVLRMWRARPGKPDTAIDVGASPGSDVFAPVTGTVVKVKRFKLYERFDDVEVHIQPENRPALDLVMIHLDDVTVAPGDRVVEGVTRIAAVRKIDKRIASQLRSYTKNKGYHTHMQLNDATDPTYKGLKGAIAVSAIGTPTQHPTVR